LLTFIERKKFIILFIAKVGDNILSYVCHG